MAQVYISSTYRDLREEREVVRSAIDHFGHKPILMEHYGASPESVLARCTKDASTATLYVLIVAWRYGSRVPSRGGKSITELEWEAARGAKIPCYVYIRDDDTEPLPSPEDAADRELVREFRQRLRSIDDGSMPARFATVQDLEKAIAFDLGPVLGRVTGIPPELRMTCDRQHQVTRVNAAWVAAAGSIPSRRGPVVALLHGTRDQGHYLFAERAAHRELGSLDPKLRGRAMLPPMQLHWRDAPKPAEFVAAMHGKLWNELSSQSDHGCWSAEEFVNARLPLVVSVEVPLDPWRTKPKLLGAYAASWFQPPFDRIEMPTIVLLYARSSEKAVQTSLRKIAKELEGLRVVDVELDDVDEPATASWAQSEPVQARCPGLKNEVGGIFRRQSKWEMEPLMNELEDIAYRLAAAGGRRR